MYKMHRLGKVGIAALTLALVLSACGGDDDDDSSSSSSASSSVASSAASSSESSSAASSESSSESSSETAEATYTWGFDDSAYEAAGTTLFSAAYDATTDNGIALPVSSDITTGAVTVDGLIFNSTGTSSSVLRYRPAGSANNSTTTSLWNTNGSFYTANTTTLPTAGDSVTSTGNMRAYMAVPVTAGVSYTITVTVKQTSSGYTAGALALLGSDNVVLTSESIPYDGATHDVSYTLDASHTYTSVKIFYSRENTTTGGVNITQIVRTKN